MQDVYHIALNRKLQLITVAIVTRLSGEENETGPPPAHSTDGAGRRIERTSCAFVAERADTSNNMKKWVHSRWVGLRGRGAGGW